jgi:hypothetical protein
MQRTLKQWPSTLQDWTLCRTEQNLGPAGAISLIPLQSAGASWDKGTRFLEQCSSWTEGKFCLPCWWLESRTEFLPIQHMQMLRLSFIGLVQITCLLCDPSFFFSICGNLGEHVLKKMSFPSGKNQAHWMTRDHPSHLWSTRHPGTEMLAWITGNTQNTRRKTIPLYSLHNFVT